MKQNVKTFKAGNLANFLSKWKSLTTDTKIIDMITGITIEFERIPVQSRPPAMTNFLDTEAHLIENEINTLLSKGLL